MQSKPYVKELVIAATLKHASKFCGLLGKYEERGILNSEMLAICSLCEELGVSAIIESGRARGYSTHLLAKYFEGKPVKIISIDCKETKWFVEEDDRFAREKLAPYKNVEILCGNSVKLMPELVKKLPKERIAILIDGPKGEEAIVISKKILKKYKNVTVAFVHDMDKGTPHRLAMEYTFDNVFFTDSEEYMKLHSGLDAECFKHDEVALVKSSVGGGEREIYEPTLAIAFPNDHKFESR